MKIKKTATYLGVQISGDLTWHNHVAKISAKGNRSLGFIRRNIRTSSRETKTLAYQTIVRPSVEYASCAWSPHQQHLRYSVEKVQRRAVRYVAGNYERKASVTAMQTALKWDSLEQRRMKAAVTMGYKIVHHIVAVPSTQLVHNKGPTRGNGMKFHRLKPSTNYYKYSFFPILIPLWNSLPPEVVLAEELEDFKEGLSKIQIKSVYH